MKLNSLIAQLKDLALKSNMKSKLAAGLFYSKKGFVATGYNTTRTYCKNSFKPSEHAECAALREVRKFPKMNYRDLKLVVIRIGLSGTLLQSTPCVNCAKTILSHGIRKIYYINEDNHMECKQSHQLCEWHNNSLHRHVRQSTIWFESVTSSSSKTVLASTITSIENVIKDPCFRKKLSEKVQFLRQFHSLSQQELAIRLCVPLVTIIKIENGNQIVTPVIYSRLVRFFDME